MNILVVTTSFPTKNKSLRLGAPFILSECVAYDKAGAKVTVISPSIESVPDRERFGKNITVKRFVYFFPRRWQLIKRNNAPIYARMNVLFFLQLPFFLFGFVIAVLKNAKDIDVIHCNWTSAALIALPAKWLYKKPVVLTIRGSDIRLIPKIVNKYIIKRVNAVIDCFGPYPHNVNLLKQFKANYIHLPLICREPTHNIGSKKPFEPDDDFTIVYVGRLDTGKLEAGLGMFTLLEAVHGLVHNHRIKCIYVGSGSLKDDLLQKAKALGLHNTVSFEGYQLDIFPYLQKAHLAVGGNATNAVSQEAMISGKIQLLPRIKGKYENIWFDKVNALLYEPGDVNSMMQAIEFAIENPDDLEKIRRNVQQTAEELIVWGRQAGQTYLQVFEKIIRQAG